MGTQAFSRYMDQDEKRQQPHPRVGQWEARRAFIYWAHVRKGYSTRAIVDCLAMSRARVRAAVRREERRRRHPLWGPKQESVPFVREAVGTNSPTLSATP
jgi:hypothetical protein